MSSFAGIGTAYSGLVAARAALEVTGQNVANANTAGYTRQRVDLSASSPLQLVSNTTQTNYGDGVKINGVVRLNDSVVDARVRSTAASSAYWSTTSDAVGSIEASLNEPSTTGISQKLSDFWSAWGGVSSGTDSGTAQASAVIGKGALVASTISAGYTAAANAWTDARSATAATVSTVNTTASKIADLNRTIRELTAAGSSNVNTLIDQRDAAVTTLAGLTGATTRTNGDGTIDVVVGGNSLVSGVTARAMALSGAGDFSAVNGDPVRVTWKDTGTTAALDGGALAARVATLGPADPSGGGTGGVYAEAAKTYDTLAKNVADAVNYLHRQGTTSTGATGLDFFAYSSTASAALTLSVVPTSVAGIAAADGTKGALDGSNADRIAQLARATTVSTSATTTVAAPNAAWTSYVAKIGSQASTADSRSTTAATAATAATTAQTSSSGVDLDEETSNLVVFQHAYQANARVLSTINDILDTLINMGAR